MSHPHASSKKIIGLSGSTQSSTQAKATRRKPRAAANTQNISRTQSAKSDQNTQGTHQGLPLPMKRLVRSIFGKDSNKTQNGGAITPRKALWASGSVVTLALLAIVPSKGTSQAIANSTCQQVIKSGAEISRGQLSSLLSIPEGASPEAVRQAIHEPYCLLPVPDAKQNAKGVAENATTREAYPLAFDPQAWVVVNYSSGAYVDYDFVFKR